ncbi:MAG TPA: alpha/beta fold hydrolase [Gaiellaceae bacterium]|nr:alpha/beta fold hydrolase [Gaiellaceae bacterium]
MARAPVVVALLVAVLAIPVSAQTSDAAGCIRPSDRSTHVSFRSADGVRLAGNILGRGATGVVLAHTTSADRCQWLPLARELAKRGYRALVFDMRGYGASAGTTNTSPHLDVVGAAAELRRRGAKRIVLVGASMGGTGVVAATPRIRPAVSGVVELSAPTAFSDANALLAAKRLRVPAFFVAGRDDGNFAAATRALYRAAATKDKKLHIAPSSWHGVDLVELPVVRKLVLGFVERVG